MVVNYSLTKMPESERLITDHINTLISNKFLAETSYLNFIFEMILKQSKTLKENGGSISVNLINGLSDIYRIYYKDGKYSALNTHPAIIAENMLYSYGLSRENDNKVFYYIVESLIY
jgi:hypothetical protein